MWPLLLLVALIRIVPRDAPLEENAAERERDFRDVFREDRRQQTGEHAARTRDPVFAREPLQPKSWWGAWPSSFPDDEDRFRVLGL